MARRSGRSPGDPGRAGAVVPAYEGPEVLSALLARAGSPHSAEEVADRFAEALAADEDRSSAIPALFPGEPRFSSPAEARRLYQNLFGLWERVASGGGAEAVGAPAEAAPEPPILPERGAVSGDRLPPDLVEAAWRHLADLGPARGRRVHGRFESEQPDLSAWLAATDLPESGGAAALGLCLEAWFMVDQAFGDRLGLVPWRALEELASEPPPLEAEQPALAAYVAEQLDNLADEDPAFGPAQRAQVERVLAAAVAAMVRTLRG